MVLFFYNNLGGMIYFSRTISEGWHGGSRLYPDLLPAGYTALAGPQAGYHQLDRQHHVFTGNYESRFLQQSNWALGSKSNFLYIFGI